MAVTVQGTQSCISALRALPFKVRERALKKAVMSGAEIAREAVEALPWRTKEDKKKERKYGPIKASVIVYKRRREFAQRGDTMNVLVGPSKKAYYAYFIEKGWKAPLGRRKTIKVKQGRWFVPGGQITTRRRARTAKGSTHSQQGLTGFREIPGRNLVANALKSIRDRIYQAMRDTFAKAV